MSNSSPQMGRVRRIHFVGIGGVGMSGIAEVLLTQGYEISGSDLHESKIIQRLSQLGANIYLSHSGEWVKDADVVVVSSAIDPSNPEVSTAKELDIPIIPRAEMLAELMRFQYGIAVAGTHGKTTTTSLLAHLLATAGLDPTYVIGGVLNHLGSNAYLGKGKFLVAEADESDASFLYLKPMMAVVTNINKDHLHTYGGDVNQLSQAFKTFIQQLPFYGLVVMCLDDLGVQALLPAVTRPFLTYGFHPEAMFRATDYACQAGMSLFKVMRPSGEALEVRLALAGQHNVQNALATIAIATELGISDEIIYQALNSFQGVNRRFQQYGEFKTEQGKFLLVDDYGHHPRELASTIQAARDVWPERRLVMVFQPHRYSRTQDLFQEFIEILSTVDQLILLDIYAAGETPILGISGKSLAEQLRQQSSNKEAIVFLEDDNNLADILLHTVRDQDIVLTQGAGTIGKLVAKLVEQDLKHA